MRTRPISAEEHERITDAIRAAEEKTSGEIICVLAHRSDGYFFPAAFAALAGLLVAGLLATLVLEGWWLSLRLSHFAILELIAAAALVAVLWFAPDLRLLLVPKSLRYRAAHANALRQFLARNIHATAARTGVLVFVSLAERYAEVIADAGINEKVPQEAWNDIVAGLVSHAGQDRLAEGYLEAIAAVGGRLAAHFPPGPDNPDELDDHLVEI